MSATLRRDIMLVTVIFIIFACLLAVGMFMLAVSYEQQVWKKQSIEIKNKQTNDLSLEHSSQWI
jgi:hypothetical protein